MVRVHFLIRLAVVGALARTAAAGSAHLVADLAPGSARGSIGLGGPAVTVADDIYFAGSDPTYFGQVWRTNGNPGNLRRVSEVEGFGVQSLTGFAGSLYFVGFEAQGVSIRKTTPNVDGAELVGAFRSAWSLTALENTLVFAADDGVHGSELWRSDGTAAGTSLLADLVPGGAGSNPFGFAAADGAVAFFFAATEAGQPALWRTDGTSAGTRPVAEFGAPPPEGVRPSVLGVVGGKLVFTTWKGGGVFRLWSSDGTASGTVPIAEFATDFTSVPTSFPYIGPSSNGTVAGGFLYFTANDGVHGDEPWRTDGTPGGTTLVADIFPGETGSDPSGFAALGDSVVFSATDPEHGNEPWIADISAPARIVRDVHPGDPTGIAYGFLAAGNAVYFTASGGLSGSEPWRTDGTANGTFRVADLAPGTAGSHPEFLFAKEGEAYFEADSGEGAELWKTDGSENGTIVVEDLAAPNSSHPVPVADGLGRLFFSTVTNEDGFVEYRTLYVTEGTPGATRHVRDFAQFATWSFLSLGGELYFAADDGVHGSEPWRSDASASGTSMIADLVTPEEGYSTPTDSNPAPFTPFHGDIAFVAGANPVGQHQLWETNGTAAGTRLIADLSPTAVSYNSPLLAFGNSLFFAAGGPTNAALWRSDGSSAGTVPMKGIGPDGIYRMVVAGDAFYFASGNTLWRSDGTAAGTQPAFTSEESIDPYRLETANGLVYFLVGNPSTLWRTDGTDAGTVPLIDSAFEPTAAGSFVYFAHDDGIHGSELWRTDGTAGGTVMIRDVRPGGIGSNPADLAAVGDTLFFSASDGVHGIEPWRSNGTAAGTVLVDDVLPGIGSSRPSRFLRSGEWVYFSADDGVHGVELWAAPAEPPRARTVVIAPPAAPVIRPRD